MLRTRAVIEQVEEEQTYFSSTRRAAQFDRTSGILSSPKAPSWAAATDGLIQSLPAFEAFLNVDPGVLKAIEFSTADHVSNLASVHSYVDDHFFSQPISSAEGWLHRLEGYVAEQKAAAALEQAGHHVEFAHLPNQAGWDLLVDGQPWQVKEGVNAAAQVKEFLAQHAGIEVVTSPDIAVHIGDPHVHALPELEHDLIAASTKDSLHGIKDGFHAGFHFPIVTFAMSSYREFKLLYHQKTGIQKVLKHVAVDVAAVGGTGFIGMKTGALIGGILGPIGAAIGLAIGGVGGAIAGKMGANAIRFASFDQAKAEYFSTVETAQDAIYNRIESSRSEIRRLQCWYQSQFEQQRSLIIERMQEELAVVRCSFENELESFTKVFPIRLDQLEAQLREEEREVLDTVPGSRLGLIFPNEFDLFRSVVRRWFSKARATVLIEKVQYLKLEHRTTDNLLGEIRRFFRDYELELETLANDIQSVTDALEKSHSTADGIQVSAIKATEDVRSRLIKVFGGRVEAVYREIENAIKHWQNSIKLCKESLLREAKPVGMDDKLKSLLG